MKTNHNEKVKTVCMQNKSNKYTLFFILFLPLTVFSQKWYHLTKSDYWIIGTQLVSGAADGFNQNIANWRYKNDGEFWDMRVSWKLKYRNFDAGDLRPAFPGAKTWLVGLTDGYHLTRTIYRAANLATISISFCDFKGKDKWKIICKRLLLSVLSDRAMFIIIYKNNQPKNP